MGILPIASASSIKITHEIDGDESYHLWCRRVVEKKGKWESWSSLFCSRQDLSEAVKVRWDGTGDGTGEGFRTPSMTNLLKTKNHVLFADPRSAGHLEARQVL